MDTYLLVLPFLILPCICRPDYDPIVSLMSSKDEERVCSCHLCNVGLHVRNTRLESRLRVNGASSREAKDQLLMAKSPFRMNEW